ncbi:MAG TPA: hypothetical protein VLH56_08480 [Dissulfurispiraceae bacterium]|nr:hypothetical protein [Dissulfurispiraceae bacterium]
MRLLLTASLLVLSSVVFSNETVVWREGPIRLKASEAITSATPNTAFLRATLTFPNQVVRELQFWHMPGGMQIFWSAPIPVEMQERRFTSATFRMRAGEFRDLAGNLNEAFEVRIVIDVNKPEAGLVGQ